MVIETALFIRHAFIFVLYFAGKNAIFFRRSINLQVFVMAVQCVFCEKGSEALNVAVIEFMLRRALTDYPTFFFFPFFRNKIVYRPNMR